MKWLNGYTMRLVLVGCVAAIVLGGGSVRADFAIDTPTNLGAILNSSAAKVSPISSATNAWDDCTIGVANGYVTIDGRPILWKVRDTDDAPQQLVHSAGSPYNYIGVRSAAGPIFMGLNEAGIASGNSQVGSGSNSYPQRHILRNYDHLDQIRDFLQSAVDSGGGSASGCFPFIDAYGNAVIFEVNRSNWLFEYDSMDLDREAQDILGFVVRANEFHRRLDGTYYPITYGRYKSGTFNVLGLIESDVLSAKTIIQGDAGPNSGYEFVRYGPGRELAAISTSLNRSTIVVHGVAPGEDPLLATMWVILGQSNYGIAVPTWVKVSDIPSCLGSGEMYNRAKSLYNKGNEMATQASTFPVETHMFDVVFNTLLPRWRVEGVPLVEDLTRIEHQMASDAYSLLDCLDNRQNDNMAPMVSFDTSKDGMSVYFSLTASDLDGSIVDTLWDFGDGRYSFGESPLHSYVAPGTYLVSCTVTDDDGVSISDWDYVVLANCDIAGNDGIVDFRDFARFASHLLGTTSNEPNKDEVSDFDLNGKVDYADLSILVSQWLEQYDLVTTWLLAHWTLDEEEGTIAYDSAGTCDGTLVGDPLWQPVGGMVNGALQFDGVDDFVFISSIPNSIEGSFSVSAWVKGGLPGQVVISQRVGVNWLCADTLEGNLMTELKGTSGSVAILSSQAVITDGNWHRIGFVWDGSHRRTLYVDDVAVAEDTQDNLEVSESSLLIGTGKVMKSGTYWSGLIDDVRIYNRAVEP